MRQWLFWSCMALMIGALAYAAVKLTGDDSHPPLRAQVRVTDILREGPSLGFAVADRPLEFQFPRDHGPHPAFRSEWWYFTGNLTAADGRRMGYQLTIFRSALKPAALAMLQEQGPSSWHADQIYMAQFAFTDGGGRRFVCSDRFSRGAAGLAGAQADPFRVWLEDWSVSLSGPSTDPPPTRPLPPGALPPLHLHVAQPSPAGDVVLDLTLTTEKAPTLQGDRGLSRKSDGAGQASYYYSLTHMPTQGTVTIGGESFALTGLSWMDREWSTSSLGADQVGWDWFAVHLQDGRDVMYYQLRRTGNQIDPHSAGSLTAPDGTATTLTAKEVVLTPLSTWHSPHTGGDYPARWRLQVPTQNIDVIIRPILPDQELNLYVQYWEGACDVFATPPGSPAIDLPPGTKAIGAAYVELTGYTVPAAR